MEFTIKQCIVYIQILENDCVRRDYKMKWFHAHISHPLEILERAIKADWFRCILLATETSLQQENW